MPKKITQRPAHDERAVVPETREREVIYLKELAQYLHASTLMVRRWAKQQGLIHRQGMGGAQRSIEYVTPYGAMRIIAHVRAKQGEEYLKGKDPLALRDAVRAYNAQWLARKKVG